MLFRVQKMGKLQNLELPQKNWLFIWHKARHFVKDLILQLSDGTFVILSNQVRLRQFLNFAKITSISK